MVSLARWAFVTLGWCGYVYLGASAEIWGQDSQWKSMVVQDQEITESSGLTESSRAGVFWTHNDSGDRARLFAVQPDSGTLGQVSLQGIEAVDWEAIGAYSWKGQDWIVVADCGDNQAKRTSVMFYKFVEPEDFQNWIPENVPSAQRTAIVARQEIQQIEVTFDDGPRDCEAIAIDAASSRILMVAKSLIPSVGVYEVRFDPSDISRIVHTKARRICTLNIPMATDMAIDKETRDIIVAGYFHAFYFPSGAPNDSTVDQMQRLPSRIEMPRMKQIEACTLDREGNLWISSEGNPLELAKLNRESIEKVKQQALNQNP